MPFAIVARILGLFLLVTAGLKLYGLTLDPAGRTGIFSGIEWQVAVFEMEVLLALWLLSGSKPVGAWLTSLFAFSGFALASFYQGWIGEASCGCFGVVKVNPWYTFSLDIVIVASLAFLRPDLGEFRGQTRSQIQWALLPLVYGAAGVVIFLGVLTGIAHAYFGSTEAAIAHLRGERISVSPRLLDMGQCEAGETYEAKVELRNWTDEQVRVVGGTSDCSCVAIADLPVSIAPGDGCIISVSFTPPRGKGVFNRKAFLLTNFDGGQKVAFRLTGLIVRSNPEVETARVSAGN